MNGKKDWLDFLVVGAQKAGTTTLFEHMRAHPQIYVPPKKEVPYFSNENRLQQGWPEYLHKNFALAKAEQKWGTLTTHYMFGTAPFSAGHIGETAECDPELVIPRRIYAQLPNVQIVAILRDPVQRAWSHYRMSVMNGLENRPFDVAINQLLHPDALAKSRNQTDEATSYIVRGEYGRILAGYFDTFPREQILVLLTDELEFEAEQLLRRLYHFVGVDPTILPPNVEARYRQGGSSRRVSRLKPAALQAAVAKNAGARAVWRSLPMRTRRRIDHRVARASYHIDLWNRRNSAGQMEVADDTLNALRNHFIADAELLAALIGQKPPWTNLADAGR